MVAGRTVRVTLAEIDYIAHSELAAAANGERLGRGSNGKGGDGKQLHG